MATPQGTHARIRTPEWLSALEGARMQFWTCLNPAHRTVTWSADVASCDTCGLTSAMTGEFAAGVLAARWPVLRQMAEDAMDFRKLVNGTCRACEDGHPCAECVLDGKRLRDYHAVLDALGDEAA